MIKIIYSDYPEEFEEDCNEFIENIDDDMCIADLAVDIKESERSETGFAYHAVIFVTENEV